MILRRLALLALVALFSIFSLPGRGVNALSDAQRQALGEGIVYFDTEDSSSTASCSTNLIGSENAEKIYNYLIGKGLQAFQAAGVMGNLQAESGFNPARVQNTPTPSGDSDTMAIDGKTGYGIAQWTDIGRQQGLHDAAVKAGTKDSDLGVQLDYLWFELTTPGHYKSSTYEPLLASTNVRDATVVYLFNFENPLDKSQSVQDARTSFAQTILTRFGSNSPSTTASSDSTTCGGSGQITGGFSLPVDKKWYNQNPDWFTKPHHDYPAADIPVPSNTNVYTMTAGKIIGAPVGGDCGTGVEVDAGNGVLFLYCHGIDGGSVSGAHKGDTVKAGQLIMHSDNTGNSTGPHLHVEIKIKGTDYCPQNLLIAIATNKDIPDLTSLPTSGCTF